MSYYHLIDSNTLVLKDTLPNEFVLTRFVTLTCHLCQLRQLVCFSGKIPLHIPAIICAGCDEVLQIESSYERKCRRTKVEIDIQFSQNANQMIKGKTLDFSPAGLRFISPQSLLPEIPIRIQSPSFEALAEAVWMKKKKKFLLDYYEVGVKMIHFKPLDASLLKMKF